MAANIVPITNDDDELIDLEVYCSDFCAKSSDSYAGWYGCVEISVTQECEASDCDNVVHGLDEEE